MGLDIQQLMTMAVTRRFGEGRRSDSPIQWLSDNGSIHTALDTIITAERLKLALLTPAMSPQSNGMSEAFVNTIKRDYVAGADRSTARMVIEQIPSWIADYNASHRHSALNFRSPEEYRREQQEEPELAQMSQPNLSHELGYAAVALSVDAAMLIVHTGRPKR